MLDGLPEIQVCTGYQLGGRVLDILPLDADEIVACEPIYETLPGWTDSTAGLTEWDQLPANARRYLERMQALIGAPIDMVSTGPDRDAHDPAAPPLPRLSTRGPSRGDRMLTDDGKHLYVSWDEYHLLIERLALKVHDSGWAFDQILCLARGGMRPGDVLSRVFDKPLAIMSTSSYRAEAGTIQGRLDMAKYITMPKGELAGRVLLVDDLADSGVTLRAVVDRLRGMPAIQRTALGRALGQGRVELHARLLRRDCCRRARGSTSRSRSTTTCGPMGWRASSSSEGRPKKKPAAGCQRRPCLTDFSLIHLVPRRGLEPPRLSALVPETSASTNSATWAFRNQGS